MIVSIQQVSPTKKPYRLAHYIAGGFLMPDTPSQGRIAT